MKKSVLSIIFFLLFSFTLVAQHALQLGSFRTAPENNSESGETPTFSISTDAGVMFGMIWEWVYYDRYGDQTFSHVLSRLDWQLNPLFFTGASGSIKFSPDFYLGFGVWLGIPGPLGYMEDWDWIVPPLLTPRDVYSISENTLGNALFTDLNAGLSIVKEAFMTMNIILGFSFKQFSMASYNSWQQDPVGSVPLLSPGKTIDYEINLSIFYLALEAAWAPVNWFSADIFLSVSPFLTFAYNRDYHYVKQNNFQDLLSFGFNLSAIVSISFHVNENIDIRIKPSLIWAPPFIGKTYTNGNLEVSLRGGLSFLLGGVTISLAFSLDRHSISSPQSEDSSQGVTLPR